MRSLGLKTVTTAGTPVRLVTPAEGGQQEILANQISIQPIKAGGASGSDPTQNTKTIYLMYGNNAKATGLANCIAIIPVSADVFSLRAVLPYQFKLSEYYLDSDANGDGALVSYA